MARLLLAAAAAAILAAAVVAQTQVPCAVLTCSGRGRCEAATGCVCWAGFEGTNCERESVQPAAPAAGATACHALIDAAGPLVHVPPGLNTVAPPSPPPTYLVPEYMRPKPHYFIDDSNSECNPAYSICPGVSSSPGIATKPDYIRPKPHYFIDDSNSECNPAYSICPGVSSSPGIATKPDYNHYNPSYNPNAAYGNAGAGNYWSNSYNNQYPSHYYNPSYNPNAAYGNAGAGNWYNNYNNQYPSHYYNPSYNPNAAYGNAGAGNWYNNYNNQYPSHYYYPGAGGSNSFHSGGGSNTASDGGHVMGRCWKTSDGYEVCT